MTHSLTYARLRAMLVRFGPKVGDVFGGARCRPLCPFVALREEACPLVAVLVAWGEEVSGPARRCLVPLVVVALCRRVLLLSMSTASLSDAASPEWHFRRMLVKLGGLGASCATGVCLPPCIRQRSRTPDDGASSENASPEFSTERAGGQARSGAALRRPHCGQSR